MKTSTFAVFLQLLALASCQAASNKWLRTSPRQVMVDVENQLKPRMKYLRVDAAPSPMNPTGMANWEEEHNGEIMMELNQVREAFEDRESSIMDAFVIEQVEDPTSGDFEQR